MGCRFAVMTLCVVVLLAGCRRDAVVDHDTPAMTEKRFVELRERYRAVDPRVQLGLVSDVLPEHRLAAVGHVDLDAFRAGDTISFLDSEQRLLTHGHVERITSTELHVRYQPPADSGREPRVGDLVIRFVR